MSALTPKMNEVLQFIRGYQARKGTSPSYEEIKNNLGYASKSRVHDLITALHERGYIRRLPNKARALIVMDDLHVQVDDATLLRLYEIAEAEKVSAEVLAGQIVTQFVSKCP